MTTPNTFGGKAVLAIAFVAGMVDMVALPVWIGTLMQSYKYSPSSAGITVTLFLLGVVLSSLFFASRFNKLSRRWFASGGFLLAAIMFFFASNLSVDPGNFQLLALLHFFAGVGVGCGLSFTDGAIGRSANPHRLWATVNIALGVFAIAFLGGMPQLILHTSASMLFVVYAALMLVASIVIVLGFPEMQKVDANEERTRFKLSIPKSAWFVIGAVICLTLNQAMVFSFVERIGSAKGFAPDKVQLVLIALGFVNLLPGILAAVLQNKWSAIVVGTIGPLAQAALALVMTVSTDFAPYAVSASVYVFMVIFTHTFLFGLLARIETSGRAVAATPAMMMFGSCIGPALGGFIIQAAGYPGLGAAALIVAVVAVIFMLQAKRNLPVLVTKQ